MPFNIMNHTSKTHNEIIKQFFSQNNRFIMHKVQKNEETRHYIFFLLLLVRIFKTGLISVWSCGIGIQIFV